MDDGREKKMTDNRRQKTVDSSQKSEVRSQKTEKTAPTEVFARPGMSPKEIIKAVRDRKGGCLTLVGMRDDGQ